MKAYYTNINSFNEEIEDFVIAKNKIESHLIENGQIEKKMSIKEFFDYIDLSNSIFMFNDKDNNVIAFNIYPTEQKDEYVVVFSSSLTNNKLIDEFKLSLANIKYNLSNLKHYTQLDLLNGILSDKRCFIINNEFYA